MSNALKVLWQGDHNICERCGERLNPAREVWLELDTRTQTYADSVPEEFSQGAFPFGSACAKREIAQHRAASSKQP